MLTLNDNKWKQLWFWYEYENFNYFKDALSISFNYSWFDVGFNSQTQVPNFSSHDNYLHTFITHVIQFLGL